MKYALNIAEDFRILSATFERYASEGMPIVDELPQGDITDYLYKDNEYIYEPIPQPDPPTPQPTIEEQVEQNRADIDFIAMMTDIEL